MRIERFTQAIFKPQDRPVQREITRADRALDNMSPKELDDMGRALSKYCEQHKQTAMVLVDNGWKVIRDDSQQALPRTRRGGCVRVLANSIGGGAVGYLVPAALEASRVAPALQYDFLTYVGWIGIGAFLGFLRGAQRSP